MAKVVLRVALVTVATVALVWWMRHRTDPVHVVLVTMGSTRVDHLQIYSEHRPTTPRLLELASESVVFEQAFAASTDTAPAIASIFTGLQVPAHGVGRDGMRIASSVPTLVKILHQMGYRGGGFVGSPALRASASGVGDGFEVYDDGGGEAPRRGDETMNAAIAWLKGEAHQRAPNFLFVHLGDPEAPYNPPLQHLRHFLRGRDEAGDWPEVPRRGRDAEVVERYARRYLGEIHMVDHQIGRLVDALARHGYWERTLFLVLADHGQTLTERPEPFGHGGLVVEEQIRVPMMIRFPGGQHAGARIDSPVHQVDVLPTVLAYLGLPAPSGHGHALQKIIEGREARPLETLLYTTTAPVPERVLEHAVVSRGLVTAVRRWPYKLVSYPVAHHARAWVLYDLQRDPQEREDIWLEAPRALKTQLKERLTNLESMAGLRHAKGIGPHQEALRRGLGYIE